MNVVIEDDSKKNKRLKILYIVIISICIRQKNNINSNNKYEYIEKLENLKNNGTITDVEFEREKSKILKEEKINESNNE